MIKAATTAAKRPVFEAVITTGAGVERLGLTNTTRPVASSFQVSAIRSSCSLTSAIYIAHISLSESSCTMMTSIWRWNNHQSLTYHNWSSGRLGRPRVLRCCAEQLAALGPPSDWYADDMNGGVKNIYSFRISK